MVNSMKRVLTTIMSFFRGSSVPSRGRIEASVSSRHGVQMVTILPKTEPMPHGFEARRPGRAASRQEMRAMLHDLHLRLAMRDVKVNLYKGGH